MHQSIRRLAGFVILAVVALVSGCNEAESESASEWVAHPNGTIKVRLVSAVEAVGDLEELRLGLHFRMDPGWKIYWRSPGAAGAPPELDWSGSGNVESAEIEWPAPSRFTTFDLQTHGYAKEVVLPLALRPIVRGQELQLQPKVSYFACNEICIPGDAVLSLDLPRGEAKASSLAALIDQYRARVPVAAGMLGITVEEALLKPELDAATQAPAQDGAMLVRLAISAERAFSTPDLFVEGPVSAFFDKPDFRLSRDGRKAIVTMRTVGAEPPELVAKPLFVTLTDGEIAVEQAVDGQLVDSFPPLPGGFAAPAPAGGLALWWIIGLALLGGLILNLMPCVLPVLSLKFLSVLGHGGRENTHVRLGFLASVAGILTSFLVLAGALAVLKAAGTTIGWGIQFQQPVFLAIMVVIVTLFAANLFGLFEIILPQKIGDLLAIDTGPRHEHHHSLGGHFLTGAFATLLATPCSAPFLGTAVGFALSRGTGEIFLVFAALGLGMSVPYMAVAAFPGLATRLPRPGAWMGTLKRFLGLLLVATAIWLVTVISTETGRDVAIGIGGLAAAMIAVFWLRRLEGSRLGRHAGKVAAVLAAIIIAAPVLAPPALDSGGTVRLVDHALWRDFDEAEIHRLVAEGKTVLVDVTADWCITCQVNKAAVLNRDPVAALLEGGTVVAMRADWTLPSQEIADYLAKFGRYGIPFNAVYGPNAPEGILLPEILVTDSVLTALEEASGSTGIAAK